jgi:hypothetical protein
MIFAAEQPLRRDTHFTVVGRANHKALLSCMSHMQVRKGGSGFQLGVHRATGALDVPQGEVLGPCCTLVPRIPHS